MKAPQEIANLSAEPRPGLGIGEIDAKSVIPEDQLVEAANNQRKVKIKVIENFRNNKGNDLF